MSKSFFPASGRFLSAVLMLGAAVILCAASASAATEKVLYTFQGGSDGGYPNGGLIFDSAGNLYGTTGGGGGGVASTVFELSPDGTGGGWVKSTLYTFQGGRDGFESLGGLAFDTAGNLYGTTASGGTQGCGTFGCGTVFELSPDGSGGWNETVLYRFAGSNNNKDGIEPVDSVVFDLVGNFYGVTVGGGLASAGTVFEFSPDGSGGWTKRTIFNFPGGNGGANPNAHLIVDSEGNLFGTTDKGGPGRGIVFKLTPSLSGGWTETVLHYFGVGQDGLLPDGAVILAPSGNLFGATFAGGLYGEGTVFELEPSAQNGWLERAIHTFDHPSGGQGPNGSLVFDQPGNLYGTTTVGGQTGCVRAGCGMAFELSPQAGRWSETILVDFAANVDGGFPAPGLTFDSEGNLYGATQGGSGTVAYYGAVFEITP